MALKDWFLQLVGLWRPALARQPASTPASTATPATAARTPSAPDSPGAAALYGVRKPLVGAGGAIAAFELSLPPALALRLEQRSDMAAMAAHQALLFAAAAPLCQAQRPALMTLTADLLMRPGLADKVPSAAWLCVPDLALVSGELVAQLRQRGVRLGLPECPPQDAPAADFVCFAAPEDGIDTLLMAASRWHAIQPGLPLVARGLQDLDQVERLMRSGFSLASGVLDRSAQRPAPKPLNAAAHRLFELLNLVMNDTDTTVVANKLRADVALGYRLLRTINSPAYGLRNPVETVEAALMLLGRDELRRWLQVLLLSVGESRQAAPALQESALARARFLELLGRERGDPAAAPLFTLGLMSMWEVLLQMPLETALMPLKLSTELRRALLQGAGPYAGYLKLAQALEGNDAVLVEALAPAFGGLTSVLEQAHAAWVWAEAMAQATRAPPAPPAPPASPASRAPAAKRAKRQVAHSG